MNMMATISRETDLEAGGVVKGVAVALVTRTETPDRLGHRALRYDYLELLSSE